jgi:hypothetical protein
MIARLIGVQSWLLAISATNRFAVHDQDTVGQRHHFSHVARDKQNRRVCGGEVPDELAERPCDLAHVASFASVRAA